ncbi:MAG: pyridoxal-phosphate dependent enzyme [Nitrospira sp.]
MGDVMAGYGVMAAEIRVQLGEVVVRTHLFVQAGVGGLAAAMADGLHAALAAPARIVVTEPASAACGVSAALAAKRLVLVPGALETSRRDAELRRSLGARAGGAAAPRRRGRRGAGNGGGGGAGVPRCPWRTGDDAFGRRRACRAMPWHGGPGACPPA